MRNHQDVLGGALVVAWGDVALLLGFDQQEAPLWCFVWWHWLAIYETHVD
jgi:hypothetical protein